MPSRLNPRLLVVFTRQLEILVTTLKQSLFLYRFSEGSVRARKTRGRQFTRVRLAARRVAFFVFRAFRSTD